MHNIVDNLISIKKEIESNNSKAEIVAVSKTFPLSKILPLINFGHKHYGENKIQDSIKISAFVDDDPKLWGLDIENIKIYDPIVKKNDAQKFFKNLDFSFTNFLQDSFKNCSLYIICNNHHIFSTMPITILSQKMKNPSIIFDYWNNFTNQRISFPDSVSYVGLGNLGKALSLKNE